jgi:hypothetical protein
MKTEDLEKSEFLKQAIAEIMHANAEALALVMAAVSRQLNAEQLFHDLEAQLATARATGVYPPAIRQAQFSLAAVQAEILLRHQDQGRSTH